MRKLYDIGIGRRNQGEFLYALGQIFYWLKSAQKLVVVDVRRKDCRSRNGKWAWQGEIGETIGRYFGQKRGVEYMSIPELSKRNNGRSKVVMDKFLRDITGTGNPPIDNLADVRGMAYSELLERIAESDDTFCLLCSCGKPYFVRNGVKTDRPYCHRTILANQLVADLGDGWGVVHI